VVKGASDFEILAGESDELRTVTIQSNEIGDMLVNRLTISIKK
jgi:hypothetical protein